MAAAHPGRVFALRRPNGGLSAARNTGIDFALAAFPALRALFCLDADNRLHPRFLARAFAALEAAPPEVGWLYPDIDEIGRPQNFTTGGDFSLLMLLAENYCDAGSLMRREVVDRGLRFDERDARRLRGLGFLAAAPRDWASSAGTCPARASCYRRRPESMLSEAERRRPALLRDLHAKHARLLRPQRLLELEAAEAPRYALFSPERPGMRLLLDPAREPVAQPRPGRRARAAAGGAGIHGDGPSAAGAGLRRRRRAGPAARARPDPQPVLAGRGAAARGRGGGDGDRARARSATRLAIEALPAGDAGASDVIMLRGRNLGGLVAGEGHRVAGKPRLAEAASRSCGGCACRCPAWNAAAAGGGAPRSGTWSPRWRGCAGRGAHRTALKPGWREDFRNWRDNVAERAYGFSGLGAVLPLLPEPGRRSFGFVLPLFALGGVERVVLRQAAALRGRGWRPHLFVLGEQRVALSAEAREALRERQPPLRHGRDGQRLEERAFRRRGRGLRQGRRGGGRAGPARRDGRGAEHPQPAGARADGAAQGDRGPHLLRPAPRGADALGQPARHRPHGAGLRARL